jgi:23S rRNA G2069 N7-methylase RlmK/C1962 C5-methylase RlmI
MITLFIYTASLAANETNKTKKKMYPLLLVIIAPPMFMQKKTQESIKSFSSYTAIMILARILMVTLVAITTQAHNPNQTLSSSF